MRKIKNLPVHPRGPWCCTEGFSLVELAIVLAIFGIVAVITVPVMISTLPNYRLKGAARDLYSAMQRAKLEAVKRSTNVGMVFTTSATGGSYLLFVDDGTGGGTSGNAIQDGGEVLVSQYTLRPDFSLPAADCTFTAAAGAVNPNDRHTGFNSQGLPLGNRTGSVQIHNTQGREYSVTLSTAGHMRIVVESDF